MKRKISDLLDAVEEDQIQISGETPLSSARVKELTMKKIKGEKRPRLYRLPVRIAAAAAAVVLLTATVFAAAGLMGAGDLMRDAFNWRSREPLTTTQVETLNSIGHVFDGSEEYSVTSNGATITPVAALADEDCYYLHLRVEAPEGVVLPDLEEGQFYSFEHQIKGLSLTLETDDGESYPPLSYMMIHCRPLPDKDPADNVKEIVMVLSGSLDKGVRYNDGSSKLLTLYGLGITTPVGQPWQEEKLFQGKFQFDIGTHFESRMAVIDCGGAAWTDPDTGETNLLDTMKLSPLGIRFDFRSSLKENNQRRMPMDPGDVRIVMKDGSELLTYHNCSYITANGPKDHHDPYYQISPGLLTETPEWSLATYRHFDTPLELDQVDYVQFGEHIYYITAE